jgi:polyisoprenoid-binding protein YceI
MLITPAIPGRPQTVLGAREDCHKGDVPCILQNILLACRSCSDVKIQAASVNTGSGLKDGTLKSEDFFNVEQDPLITFHSTKIVQTGPETFDVQGTFTIRGVSKPETLHLTLSGKGTGSGEIDGTMAFDRKDYGMTSGIPFIRIADRVEVSISLKGTRVSGPPVVFKQ